MRDEMPFPGLTRIGHRQWHLAAKKKARKPDRANRRQQVADEREMVLFCQA